MAYFSMFFKRGGLKGPFYGLSTKPWPVFRANSPIEKAVATLFFKIRKRVRLAPALLNAMRMEA